MENYKNSGIYNAPSIYESGAGGGGGSEGENGAGSVNMPEGFTRLIYFQNNKLNNFFRCKIGPINFDSDCIFEFSLKTPIMNPGESGSFYPVGNQIPEQSIKIGIRDWTGYVGTTYFNRLEFFGFSYEGSSITNLSNKTFNMKLSKTGLYIDDSLIKTFHGPFNSNVFDTLYFPDQLSKDHTTDDVYIYKFSIKKNDSILIDCLPVKNNDDGTVGFLDLINSVYYPCSNATEGPVFPY